SENLRSKMVQASGLNDNARIFTWNSLRGIFFRYVDIDKSLSKKASLAYFNGFIWTFCADVRAIALTFAICVAPFAWFGVPGALAAAGLFLVIALMTFLASRSVTRRHMAIGDEQIEIIEHFYRDELIKKLEE